MSIARLRGPLFALALATSLCSVGGNARAQSAPTSADVQLSTQVSSRRIEVGDSVVVQVTALSSGNESPSEPQLKVRGNAEVHGPNVRTELRMFSNGASFTRQRGLTATWTVTPSKVGRLVVGPGSFKVDGRVMQGETITIDVVPAGSAPSPRGRGAGPSGFPDPMGPDPFDFFRRRMLPGFNDNPFDDVDVASVPEELKLDRAPNQIAFLRQEATPHRVVIGEQVLLRAYLYGGRGPFGLSFVTQPTTPDFLSFPFDQDELVPYRVPIGDTTFVAIKVREIALFPLHAGKLTIGGAELALSGRGYPATSKIGYSVAAKPITITVVEPPLAGRPPGYVLGDVGNYLLSAEVEPRELEQGGMVAVTAQLKGVGNVPSHITPPEQKGVEWLEPSVRGNVEVQGTNVGGSRTFRWTVRIDKAGEVELGQLSLPYFDPTTRRYEIARAELGKLNVKAGQHAATPQGQAARTAPEKDAPGVTIRPRAAVVNAPQAPRPLTDHPAFFWAPLLLPLSVPALGGLSRGGRALIALLRRDKGGAARVAATLARAKRATESAPAEAAADFERALYDAIEVGAGVKARGLMRSELVRELTRAGVPEETGLGLKTAIEDLEAFRFTGEGDLVALGARVSELSRTLAKKRQRLRERASSETGRPS